MGRDKGRLSYSGEPQASVCWQLLDAVCARAFVSIRRSQANVSPYRDLPCILDDGGRGPVAGLLAAWTQHPGVAWLLLAADMPLIDESVLGHLIGSRDHSMLATAFRQPDGIGEPLCAIWEPGACGPLEQRAKRGLYSLRELLETAPVAWLEPSEPERLRSVDTPADYRRIRARVGRSG